MTELSKTYSPKEIESTWYKKWEDGKYFAPKKGKAGLPYSILMPPPNVTGILHAGHALDVVTQDALIRFKRMKGFEALWLPGADHAGIATQNVVEKLVYKEEGKTKHDYKREDFVKKIWEWKEKYGGIIAKQQRSLGASADWDYFTFTMDKIPNQAVRKVFTDLFNEGLIYQADYIVNWDTALQSAISDAEVDHVEIKGAFYHLLYEVKGSDQKIEIATTRPETLLGDTAVAVNPNDERFAHLIGKEAIVPICNRVVPIVGDEYVDIEKGTGCLKVTPGHDFNDFEIGKRHQLPIVNILNKDGTLNDEGLEFKGMSCKEARKGIIKKLEEMGILVATKDHVHPVGHGGRSKTIIEPLVSKQWFLNVQEMAKTAVDAITSDRTRFYPKGWENTYFSWLNEPKDWCISRQLWWGHQIPVYYCGDCDHTWASENEATICPKCQSESFEQDPDVLDTWFSSGLWPLSTLGWPDPEVMKEKKFDTFFPSATLVTGYDIIFFWVARMMMMTLKSVDEVPFEKIYIHAIVRDKYGKKMSKSLGNGIDPLETIEQYGADAFRFTLAAGSGYNRGLNLDPERIGGYRNFINKLWNAFRFIHPFLTDAKFELPKNLDHHERWILSELNSVSEKMNESLDEFRFDDACSSIYSFVYDKFCSWFIELSKNILHGDDHEVKVQRATVLRHAFRKVVALLHPIVPFITEELWTQLKNQGEDLLIIHDYPEYDSALNFAQDQEEMNRFIDVVTAIRNLRASVNIKPKEMITAALYTDDKKLRAYFENNKKGFKELGRIDNLIVDKKSAKRPPKSIMAATTHSEVFLPLEGVIDIDEQVRRLNKDLNKTSGEFYKLEAKLNNQKFLKNAPPEVVDEVKAKATAFKEKIGSIKNSLKCFE